MPMKPCKKLITRFGCEVLNIMLFRLFSENFDRNTQQIINNTFLTEIQSKLNVLLNTDETHL